MLANVAVPGNGASVVCGRLRGHAFANTPRLCRRSNTNGSTRQDTQKRVKRVAKYLLESCTLKDQSCFLQVSESARKWIQYCHRKPLSTVIQFPWRASPGIPQFLHRSMDHAKHSGEQTRRHTSKERFLKIKHAFVAKGSLEGAEQVTIEANEVDST